MIISTSHCRDLRCEAFLKRFLCNCLFKLLTSFGTFSVVAFFTFAYSLFLYAFQGDDSELQEIEVNSLNPCQAIQIRIAHNEDGDAAELYADGAFKPVCRHHGSVSLPCLAVTYIFVSTHCFVL